MALVNKTMARRLRIILKDILIGIVYNSQNVKNIFKYVIAKDTFTTKVPVLIELEFTSDADSEQ